MARGWVRAAVYLPGYQVDGVRRSGPDEDAFTMGAAALERLGVGRTSAAAGPVRLIAWGEAVEVPTENWQGVLGVPVERIDVPHDRATTWGDLLAAAGRPPASGSSPLTGTVVVGAVAPERGAGSSAPEEGGYALLVDELSSHPGNVLHLPAADAPAVAWPFGSTHDVGNLPAGVAVEAPSELRALPKGSATPGPGSVTRVSEGAYLPPSTYREGWPSRWRFEGERCGGCSTTTFPSRGRCRGCGASDGLLPAPLPRDRLRVEAITWIGPGGQPTEFDDLVAITGVYGVALVELAQGIRATVALTDAAPGSVRIGDRLDTRLRRLYALDGSWRYGRKGIPTARPPGP